MTLAFLKKKNIEAKKATKEKNWFDNNLKAFFRLITNNKIGKRNTGHNQHVYTIVWSMLDDGYSFQAETSSNKNEQIIETGEMTKAESKQKKRNDRKSG